VPEPACGTIVGISESRVTMDTESNRITVNGQVLIGAGGPVKNVDVCLGKTCARVAGGKVLNEGDVARFAVSVRPGNPAGLRVQCSVMQAR
jgi:hypothetical protein